MKPGAETKIRWTEHELGLLGKIPDSELARHFGRSMLCVSRKRQRLGIPPVYERRFTSEEKALLGTMSDEALARQLGRSVLTIRKWRRKAGIPMFNAKHRAWAKKEIRMLGKYFDGDLAFRLKRDVESVRRKRLALKPVRMERAGRWLPEEVALFTRLDDLDIAERTGRSLGAVYQKRASLNRKSPF